MKSSRWDDDHDSSDDEKDTSSGLNLPTSPPFHAYVHGLKAEVKEEHLKDFFGELEVKEVSVEEETGKVEFKDRDNLARALFYCGRLLLGREVKVDLSATPPPKVVIPSPAQQQQQQHQGGGGLMRQRSDEPRRENGRSGGGGDRRQQGQGGRGGYNNGGRGGGGGYRSQRGDRENDRGHQNSGPPRDFNRPAPWTARGSGGQSSSEGGGDATQQPPTKPQQATAAVTGDKPDNITTAGDGEETPQAEKPQRKRLQLKPRTKPVEAVVEPLTRNSSIFGGGKPHDEVEWEKRRQEHEKGKGSEAGDKAEDNKDQTGGNDTEGGGGQQERAASEKSSEGTQKCKSPHPQKGERPSMGAQREYRSRSNSFGKKDGAPPSRRFPPAGERANGGGVSQQQQQQQGETRPSHQKEGKKEKTPKKVLADDEWQEVEVSASAEKARKRVDTDQHEGIQEKPQRAVGGAFGALLLDDDSEDEQ